MSFYGDIKKGVRKNLLALDREEAELALMIMRNADVHGPTYERFMEKFEKRVEEMRS